MNKYDSPVEKLNAILDLVEESILEADKEEIVEEIVLEGRSPDRVADQVSNLIAQTIKSQKQQKLIAAKKGFAQSAQKLKKRIIGLPETIDEKRALLAKLTTSKQGLPAEFTMAFREGKNMSEEDITGMLNDLAELGFLDDFEDEV